MYLKNLILTSKISLQIKTIKIPDYVNKNVCGFISNEKKTEGLFILF